jgi:Uma2 family endonuclease
MIVEEASMSTAILPGVPATPQFPSVPLLTAEEFAERYDGQRVELVKGIVEELPMPKSRLHGKACIRFGAALLAWADERDCGHVMSNDTWIRTTRAPDSVRGPDLFYIGYEKIAKDDRSDELTQQAPDLVAEVKSPSDSWTQINAKTREYLQSKIPVVVILDPVTKSAMVYRDNEPPVTFAAKDDLVVSEVLPGFAVNVGSLFV